MKRKAGSSMARFVGAIFSLAVAGGAFFSPATWAADSAVILMYHRFGETDMPSTNIRLEQFEAHIEELKSGPYTVLPVPEIMAAIEAGRPLPERTVGITVDDAFKSVYSEAWPRLKKAGLPFTLFVSTNAVDQGFSRYMSWAEIKEMAEGGVTIGNHASGHHHMAARSKEANRADIAKAVERFEAELGFKPKLFAYPYGEASRALAEVVGEFGFTTAFGQHSGAVGKSSEMMYLPRFALNEKYGDLSRFKMAVNVVPLPVSDVSPADWIVEEGANPPPFGFTVSQEFKALDQLACYASHEGKAKLEILGDVRVEVRMETPFPKGRSRINCTAPAGQGRWHWFSRQFYNGGEE